MSGELGRNVRIEGPGARIRRTVSDGRGVEVKKLKRESGWREGLLTQV